MLRLSFLFKIFSFLTIASLFSFFPFSVFSASDTVVHSISIEESVQKASDYILNQSADPNWVRRENVDWPLMGLSAAGRLSDMNEAVLAAALEKISGTGPTDFSRKTLAVTAAGENPVTIVPGKNLVAELRNFYDAETGQFGSATYLNDDFWVVMGLAAAGVATDDAMIRSSKDFILAHQKNNGGWSYAATDEAEPDADDTAAALMALAASGVTTGDAVNHAFGFLREYQNDDGGFASLSGGRSNSDTTAWVLSALSRFGQESADWIKGGKTPRDFLVSMQRPEGYFVWQQGNSQKANTGAVLVALTGKYFPVRVFSALGPVAVSFRIEGSSENVCQGEVEARNPLEVVENAQHVCGYQYELAYEGKYLHRINGDAASGDSGWLYLVNWNEGEEGARDHALQRGDAVTWYFGQAGWEPLKLDAEIFSREDAGEEQIEALAESYDGQYWQPAVSVSVSAFGQTFLTDSHGKVVIPVAHPGNIFLFAQKQRMVRSNSVELNIGSPSDPVPLSVNVLVPPKEEPEPEISFTVTGGPIDFGTVQPGMPVPVHVLTLRNTGNVNIDMGGVVEGHGVFTDYIFLNSVVWTAYEMRLGAGNAQNVSVGLSLPQDYSEAGQKDGSLTFWATQAEDL